jgi:hypothetical protein
MTLASLRITDQELLKRAREMADHNPFVTDEQCMMIKCLADRLETLLRQIGSDHPSGQC